MRAHTALRTGAIFLVSAMLLTLAGPTTAATPSAGELTDDQPSLSYRGGPFILPNRSDPLFGDGSTLECVPELLPCDDFALTVSLPAGFPDASVRVAVAADNGTSDYDIYVLDEGGNYVAIGYNPGGTESTSFSVRAGVHRFTVRVVPWSSNAAAYGAEITLNAPDPNADTDTDGVPDVVDVCPNTPPGATADESGCSGTEVTIPSGDAPRVVVADIDSAINPYHDFYYQRPSSVTKEVLEELGVKPHNVVQLTRTGNFAADLAADAGFWASVKRGELYHFAGTNIIAASFALEGVDEPYLKPTSAKNPHGVGTSAAVLTANPDAIIYFIEANSALGSAESHAAAFQNPAVDFVTTSYGVSVAFGLLPLPEYRAFEHSYEGVVERGKLHFSSGGNGPGVTALRGGAGPWWAIGVSGVQEYESEGDTLLSGNLPDFVSDFTQNLPYCMDCESGRTTVSGTSFSTPRSAGLASKVLLDVRRALDHKGGIRSVGGTPTMASDAPSGKGWAKACANRTCTSVTNWQLRRALEQAAWIPATTDYDASDATAGGFGVPISPVAPWLQIAWGDLTVDDAKGVISAAHAELSSLTGFDFGGTPRVKPGGYCEFQTTVIQVRRAWWNEVAPTLPDSPLLDGETPPGAVGEDPFVYCELLAP
ncbi:MAG: hypothetical protein M3N29_06030 [Chloroflexota bacterium]|nr:hypothetical protein [Chloroflexota bacterium]